ncbi:MAG: hypothetical protein IJV31_06450 [Clostridia bacterium]|nr:hypothetical protein [Clostridia bacterium]
MINTLDFENSEYFIYGITEKSLYSLPGPIPLNNKKFIDSDKNILVLVCPDIDWIKAEATTLFISKLPKFPIKDYKILTLNNDELSGIVSYLQFENYYDKCYKQYIIKQDTNSLNLC